MIFPALISLFGAYLLMDDKKTYAGGGSTLLAPNGKPSNLTPEQWKLVRTPEFKAWFGDWENDAKDASKVVDSNGEPLVCYHGTNSKFSVFKTVDGEGGNYTVGSHFGNKKQAKERGQKLLSVFLNIRNMPRIIDYQTWYVDDWVNVFSKINIPIIGESWEDIIYALEQNSIDGFVYKNKFEGDKMSDSYIVFNPNQIKIADGSNTTFDENNPDIKYEKGGIIGKDFKIGNVTLKVDYAKEKDFDEIYGIVNNDVGYVGQPRLVLTENNKIIGAIYKERYTHWKTKEEIKEAEYKFDIVIKKSKRRKGYAKYLLNAMIYDFVYNYPKSDQIRAELINKKLQKYLDEKYEFSCNDGNQENIMYCYLLRKEAIKLLKKL